MVVAEGRAGQVLDYHGAHVAVVDTLRTAVVEVGYGLGVVGNEFEVVWVILVFCGGCGLKEAAVEDRVRWWMRLLVVLGVCQ